MKIVTSGFMVILLSVPLLAKSNSADQNTPQQLSWEIIAEKFCAKQPFCTSASKDEKADNFAIDTNTPFIALPSNIKISKKQTGAEMNLSVWQENKWTYLQPIVVQINPDGLTIDSKAIAEGFYSLSLVFDKNNVGQENNFYAIITADWKKNLFTWCLKNKEQIETNPDTKLIHSSIAVSHFDNVMELASKSKMLSGNILSALSKATKAKADFEDGSCPDLVIGLNKLRLKRFEGAAIAEFAIHVPQEYSDSKKWPIYLDIDPSRWGVGRYGLLNVHRNRHKYHDGMLDMWWHTTFHKDLRWKDYASLMEILKQKLNIDNDRKYLFAYCENAIAGMALAVKYPDQWAECFFSTGNSFRHLAGNAINLSMIYDNAHPESKQTAYTDFAVKCFDYFGCKNFIYTNTKSASRNSGLFIPQAIRSQRPRRVLYTIESLANPSAYWVQIDGREDENFIASIDAVVWGQSILIKTDNVDAYTLNLELAPLDCNRPVEIIENNHRRNSITGPVFVRKSPKYETCAYIKNKSLHGPVSDVFTDPYAVVFKGDESIKKLAAQIAGSGPCFSDAALPTEFVDTHNIIFVGRLDQSRHFAQITDKLPLIIEDGRLTANGRVYEGDFGAIYVYPNPLNTQKYLAILSGSTDKASELLNSAWSQIKSKDNADIGIFNVSENSKIQWRICEKFNTIWNWHQNWNVPLAKLTKTYPKWKWRQWVARILREQLSADMMILQDPCSSAQLPDTGELTLRDISRIFKNDWLVKISLKGSDLREFLKNPFNDSSSREVFARAIDGASLAKQPAGSNIICINELERDRLYTVACHYKAVNGKSMGRFIKNYRLKGAGFLVTLLKRYLKENNGIDLDTELDSMRLNVF
ncbi:MAG: hypothetical protein ACYTFK_08935 [Planctomycetota bacterium]|jgi:hypothetical protein